MPTFSVKLPAQPRQKGARLVPLKGSNKAQGFPRVGPTIRWSYLKQTGFKAFEGMEETTQGESSHLTCAGKIH